jgi:hypothetical protein
LNDLGRALKAKLFTAKLLRHRREANIRDFLGVLARTAKKPPAEQRFFDGFDSNTSLLKQGVRVWDCQDYSSGRGYDEGAIVNKIVLSRNGGRVAFFLKGLGRIRKSKIEAHGIRGFENFEVTALAAAKIVGLNSIECKRYLDDADVTMVGYTLFQEIVGVNTNMLFRRLPGDTFAIQPPFAHLRDRLIREFAQVAALSDLLRKGDRKIVQPLHPEYDANCLVNLQLLHGHPRRRAIWAIDHNHLFQSDNQGVLHDLRYGKCPEMGIVTAFDEFYSGSSARLKLLETFERAYLAQWRRIQINGPALEKLISQQHGQQSAEYRIFRESLAADPRLEFRAQKVELLRASAGSPAGTMKSKQTRRIG